MCGWNKEHKREKAHWHKLRKSVSSIAGENNPLNEKTWEAGKRQEFRVGRAFGIKKTNKNFWFQKLKWKSRN